MKKAIITTILLVMVFISFSQNEWTMIHPYPTIDDLKDLHFINNSEGWVVGESGLIMYTNDGCEEWEIQHQELNESINAIFFISDNEGWATGGKKVYHTINKGQNWEEQEIPSIPGQINDIYFFDSENGWAVGSYKVILKTGDGGDTWTRIMSATGDARGFECVKFSSEFHGCAVGGRYWEDGLVMITNDGGITWTETTPENSDTYHTVFLMDSITGWIAGDDGEFRKTIDGGNTWQDLGSIYYNNIDDLHFYNDSVGIFLSYNSVRLTYDGGASWDSVYYMNTNSYPSAFFCWNDTNIISVGNSGNMSRSFDGGINWEKINKGPNGPTKFLGFINNMEGYALSGYTTSMQLLHTYNGGYNWIADTIINSGTIYQLCVYNESAFLIDDSSQILRSIDGSSDWEIFNVPDTSDRYRDIEFISNNNGFICADNGVLFYTQDGGQNWIDRSLSGDYNLRDMYFIDSNRGWIIDPMARIVLSTIDGGISWDFAVLGDVYLFEPTSVYFVNDSIGYITTREGVILNSSDGGHSWVEYYVFPGGYNSQIYFINELEGWYRSASVIYHTYDGGLSWTERESIHSTQLQCMFFLDNQGWLGGNDGLVATSSFYVGLEEETVNTSSLSVYPNPASDKMYFVSNDIANQILDVKVVNLQGQELLHLTNNTGSHKIQISVSDLPSGTYIANINSLKSRTLIKFFVY